jgi:hypothetical protein
MKRVIFPLLTALVSIAQDLPREEGRWPFAPGQDEFRTDALLDLRGLNEKVAGEKGFVRVDARGDFVRGDGGALRFWAVNSTVEREKPYVVKPRGRKTEPDVARHARFLAKRGVNLVRLHAHINPSAKASSMEEVNQGEMEWIWRSVAAYKKEGIYTVISPYWPNTMEYNASWEMPGMPGLSTHGLLFFDERIQASYKGWMRKLLAEPNPYTGIPLAQDPALAIIQLQNEDSLLFWTVNNIKGEYRLRLGSLFYHWAVRKYGSWDATQTAWGGKTIAGDMAADGTLEFYILWEMTQPKTSAQHQRLADQLEFYVDTMRQFHANMSEYLKRELGCGQLVNATNWKSGDPVRLEDAERYSYMTTDVLAVNRYYSGVHNGPNRSWAVVKGDEYTSPSILSDPRSFPLNIKQPKNRPFLITESAWVMPMEYSSEGPLLVAAYQGLTGIDAYCWFNTGDDEWTPPQSANGYLDSQGKWLFGNPDMLGAFPAAALMHRMGYVRRGEPAVEEHRALADLWTRKTPIVAESASWDPNRDAGDIAPSSGVQTGVSNLAFLAGPVEVVFGGDPAKTRTAELEKLISPDQHAVISTTGELGLHAGERWFVVDTPKAQGVAAFFDVKSEHALSDITVKSQNDYGTLLVVAMDDRPLRESRRILVQAVTRSRPTGWSDEEAQIKLSTGETVTGKKITSHGRAPWQVRKAQFDVELRNAGITRAVVLDANGNAAGETGFERTENGLRFRFPEEALYLILIAGE